MAYYKSNAPVVLKAWNDMILANAAMWVNIRDFAHKYGACTPIVSKSISCFRFGGLRFNPKQDTRFWTKPGKTCGTQRPRMKIKGDADERCAQKALLQAWNENHPTRKVDLEPLYRSFGTSWGDLFFCGIGYFEGNDGFVYVATDAKLAPHMIEVLHSEYLAARKASEVSQ